MSLDRLGLVQTFFQRFFNGDVADAVALLDPAVAYCVPGLRTVGGTFVGRAAVAEHLERFLELTERPVDVLKWEDWLTGESNVAGVVRLELQRPGRLANTRQLVRKLRGGCLVEVELGPGSRFRLRGLTLDQRAAAHHEDQKQR